MSEKRRQQLKARFLKTLAQYPIISVACQRSGIPRSTLYEWRKLDPDFSERIDEAELEGRFVINDLAESKLIAGIKNAHHPSITLWLTHNHKRYGKNTKPAPEIQENPIHELLKAYGIWDAEGNLIADGSSEPKSPSNDKSPP